MAVERYIVYPAGTSYVRHYVGKLKRSDPYAGKRVLHDELLHKALTQIFREEQERCCGSDGNTKKLLLHMHNTEWKDLLELVLERKPSLRTRLPRHIKLSLLWIAVLSRYQKSAELLVLSGADVNERCEIQLDNYVDQNTTILHLLLQMYPSAWNERFVALIADHGADLQARDGKCRTALHWAVSLGRVRLVEILLEKGADVVVNLPDNDGETPLLAAVDSGKIDELLPLLLKHGADVNSKDGFTQMNVLHRLANLADVEHVDAARVLIEKGVSLDDRDLFCLYRPIHLAVRKGKNEMVKLFLDHGADVNARAKDDVTPLYLAARCKNPDVLLTLLKRGANIDSRTRSRNHPSGRTALHNTYNNSWEIGEKIAKILLCAGADVCAEDQFGKTPLSQINLLPDIWITNPHVRLFLKMLAQKKASQPSIVLKDEMTIATYSTLWNLYQECVEQIGKAKSTRIIARCTFFDLLTKCQCQIAALMRNPEFESKFGLYDLNAFSMYAQDMREAFERAHRYHQAVVKQQEVIIEAVYDSLPYVVVREVVDYIFHDCEICEVRKIVDASRSSVFDSSGLFRRAQ